VLFDELGGLDELSAGDGFLAYYLNFTLWRFWLVAEGSFAFSFGLFASLPVFWAASSNHFVELPGGLAS